MFGKKKSQDNDANVITPIVEEMPQATLNTQNNSSFSSPQAPNNPAANLNININTGNNQNTTEEKGKRKISAKLISTILAIGITGTLVGFAAYSIISLPISQSTKINESYLNITNYSYTKTTRILADFKRDNSKKIKDYALVGSKLFVGECKLTPTAFDTPGVVYGENNYGFALYDLENDTFGFNNGKTDIDNKKYYIDFSLVPEGKYVIYPIQENSSPETSKSDLAPYSIKADNQISLSFYTLPSVETGIRKKITLRNNSLSPFTLIDVIDIGTTLASGYYDVAIYPSIYAKADNGEEKIDKSETPNNELINLCNELVNALNNEKSSNDSNIDTNLYRATYADSIEAVSKLNVNSAIGINSSLLKNYTSTYLQADTYSSFSTYTLSNDTTLPKFDAFPEIRELTGYLDHSGEAFGGIPYNDLVSKSDDLIGIESSIICTADTNGQNTLGNIKLALRR